MLTRKEKVAIAEERCDVAFTRMLEIVEAAPLTDNWKEAMLKSIRVYLHTSQEFLRATLTATTED